MTNLSEWKIIIVDDEPDARAVLIPLLEHFDIAVVTAETGEEALRKLSAEHPTLAIIDLALPGIDGWGVLRYMQTNPDLANIPAVAITAYHSNSVAHDAIEAGFAAYFPKPINARSFVDELESILG